MSPDVPEAPRGSLPDPLPPVAWPWVSAVALTVVAALLALAGRYDYHRDELYFRLLGAHPAWGYVDQPPLTPLLVRAAVELLGDTLWAVRVPAALCTGALAVILALIAREVGGGRGAQVLAASASASVFPLISGHVLVTTSLDLPLWTLVCLCVLRAALRGRPGYWVVAGAVAGVALYNKLLVVLLLAGLLGGLAAVGPREVLRGRHLWLGAGTAALVGLPNLAYQVAAGLPQWEMAGAIAENKGPESRVLFVPLQVLLVGPVLTVVWVAGFLALLRRTELRPVRFLAVAYPLMGVVVLLSGGQPYYPSPLLLTFTAVGAVVVAGSGLARRPAGRILLGAGLAVNIAFSALVALPLVPEGSLGGTPLPALNQVTRDQVGWQRYVAQVARVVDSLPDEESDRTVLLVGNYGEAGALDRYGTRYGLPPVYSGHNALHTLGPPPARARTVVVLFQGDDTDAFLSTVFATCTVLGALDNGVGVDNEEQGTPIRVCREPRAPWRVLWPRLRHLD